MDIKRYLEAFAQRKYADPDAIYDMRTAKNLLLGDGKASFVQQEAYEDSEYLAYNIKVSVSSYERNKDVAISIYMDFLALLKSKCGIEVSIQFPPIAISNTFERLMFIAKYLQDPRHKTTDLPDLLWVSQKTINDDIKRLQGDHKDPIQICGKVFTIEDLEKQRSTVYFPSTAHPLFLTPNLTQVLVTLKGLRAMAEKPLYAEYARTAAADIWEQLSDYAKTRIHYVLSELMPEDLSWYESLHKNAEEHFYSEVRCSGTNVVLDCMKNGKSFCVEYQKDGKACFYSNCTFVPHSYDGVSIEVKSNDSQIRLDFEKIISSAYTAEELM